jgi:hypothetical protein
VSCVVRYRNALRKAGCLEDRSLRRTIARCAARSTCGKPGKVICCHASIGACNDADPNNGVAEGVCSNDGEVACDGAADCVKTSGQLTRDPERCLAAGGTVTVGSVCTACSATTTTTSTTTTTVP